MSKRKVPNVLITGTPGTGKTTLSKKLALNLGYKHINLSEKAKTKNWISGYDEEFDTFILNENKCLDSLEEKVKDGGIIVDYHSCEFFPERWFDLVVVLRCSTEQLFDRLIQRNYSTHKLNQNQECEIMQIVLEEAMQSYHHNIVKELNNNTLAQMNENIVFIIKWITNWK